MNKRVSFYLTVVTVLFTLQSCVSNYVVSMPNEYKPNAKLATLTITNLNDAKKELTNSDKIDQALASLEAAKKNEVIKKAILHSAAVDHILQEAYSYLGTPYRYGGMSRSGIDCSAFVLSVFNATSGISLPRVAASQAKEGESVDKESLQKGDLVFFSHGRGIAHVGIVESVEEGEVKFIHAATSKGVMISSLNDRYWGPRFRFAKRIIPQDYTGQGDYLVNN